MNKITGPITKTLESWDCNDLRLPSDKELQGPPPDTQMLDTIAEIQLQPIGMVVVRHGKHDRNADYYFRWGGRRLRAIRQNLANGKGSGMVDVLIIMGIDPDNSTMLTLIENSVRSPNEVSAYTALKRILKDLMKSGGDLNQAYKEAAKWSGYSVGEVKAIETRWHKVPVWTVNAVERGDIAPSVAIAVGKLGADHQAECKEDFQANGKLSAKDVHDKKQITQANGYASLSNTLFPQTRGREWFHRDDLVALQHEMKNPEDIQMVQSLLDLPE
jgi:hypothetical protein